MNRLLVPLCCLLLASPVTPQNGSVAEHPRVKEAIHLLETWIEAQRAYDDIPGVSPVPSPDGHYRYSAQDGASADAVLRAFLDAGIAVQKFEVALPSLNEVFIEEVSRARHDS